MSTDLFELAGQKYLALLQRNRRHLRKVPTPTHYNDTSGDNSRISDISSEPFPKVVQVEGTNIPESSNSTSVKACTYLSLVHPTVEYAMVAWSPHTNKGIDCIKSVQHRTARFVNSDYSPYRSVSSMLTDLNWPSLQSRRRICDLGMFYEISRGTVPAYGRTRVSHDFKISSM